MQGGQKLNEIFLEKYFKKFSFLGEIYRNIFVPVIVHNVQYSSSLKEHFAYTHIRTVYVRGIYSTVLYIAFQKCAFFVCVCLAWIVLLFY